MMNRTPRQGCPTATRRRLLASPHGGVRWSLLPVLCLLAGAAWAADGMQRTAALGAGETVAAPALVTSTSVATAGVANAGLVAAPAERLALNTPGISPGLAPGLSGGPSRAGLATEALQALDARLDKQPHDVEATLIKGLVYFGEGRLDDALHTLDALLQREPNFRLAQLIRGDMLLARTQPVTGLGGSPLLAGLGPAQLDELKSLRDEARARLQAYLAHFNGRLVPRQLLALGDTVERALLVDKRAHRLYIFRNAGAGAPPRLERDFYVSTGKLVGNKNLRGDLRTPEGVYFVTGYIPDARLPDKYGIGAFPVNYPNAYDRHLGKTGGGIWLHGTVHDTYSRPPRDSEGCVVMTNPDLSRIKPEIQPGVTPVIITDHIDWIDREQWQRERASLFAALDAWRRDWQSNNVEAYLSHYAPDFWSGKYDFRSWAAYKRQVALGKSFQQVSFSDISLFVYPQDASDGRQMVVANFRQRYNSNNFNGEMSKRLYLARENGVWRILYEGPGVRVSGK